MTKVSRRQFLATAAAIGAVAAFARSGVAKSGAVKSRVKWTERRDLYPEGVASGDPQADSVLLWTRRPRADAKASVHLTCEVAADSAFEHIVTTTDVKVSAASDWTCRVLVGGLEPAHEYWYRFTDADGNGSRVGRTLTAPADDDARPVRFAFVSCQNVNDGAQNAYRRMIFEDEKAAPEDRLGFVLHLGDFIYELVWYPEDRPQGMYDRRIREHRALCEWREARGLPYSDHGRRLSRGLSRLSARSGSAGCARAFSVRGDVGQPRIQLARLAEFPGVRRRDARAAEAQGRRDAGLVRVSAGADQEAESRARALRRAARRRSADRKIRRTRTRHRAQQSHRAEQPHRLPRAALGSPRRSDHHGPTQLSIGRSDAEQGSGLFFEQGLSAVCRRGGAADSRCRPDLERRQAAGHDPLRRCRRAELPQGCTGADDTRRRRRRRGFSSG